VDFRKEKLASGIVLQEDVAPFVVQDHVDSTITESQSVVQRQQLLVNFPRQDRRLNPRIEIEAPIDLGLRFFGFDCHRKDLIIDKSYPKILPDGNSFLKDTGREGGGFQITQVFVAHHLRTRELEACGGKRFENQVKLPIPVEAFDFVWVIRDKRSGDMQSDIPRRAQLPQFEQRTCFGLVGIDDVSDAVQPAYKKVPAFIVHESLDLFVEDLFCNRKRFNPSKPNPFDLFAAEGVFGICNGETTR